VVACAIAAWVVIGGLPAMAQDGTGDDGEGDIEAFRMHVARGAELRQQERYREALARFEKARAIADHPKLMLATGNLREAIGDCGRAREDMRQALDDGRGSTELRKKLVAALEENRQCVNRGVIVVACEPKAAEVHVGRRQIACGEEIELDSGWHTLTARAAGHRDAREQVSVEPGGHHRHDVVLEEVVQVREEPDRVPQWMRYGAFGSMGTGAALVVAGFAFDLSATGRQDELQRAHLSGDAARADRLVREADSAQTRTVVLYSSGVVLAAAGGLLWVYDEEVAGWLEGGDGASVRPQVHVGAGEATVGARLVW
jgi:hypothetical protein